MTNRISQPAIKRGARLPFQMLMAVLIAGAGLLMLGMLGTAMLSSFSMQRSMLTLQGEQRMNLITLVSRQIEKDILSGR